jgi:DmsE family decaheme c-type cytochrome
LLGFAPPVHAEEPKTDYSSVRGAPFPTTVAELVRDLDNGTFTALADFVQQIDAGQPKTVSLKQTKNPHPQFDDAAFSALREFAQQIGGDQPNSVSASPLKLAEADNAFDALREFLQRGAQPNSTPGATPNQPRTTAPRRDRAVIDATYVGEKVCMTCHAKHAAEFGKTLMGRIASVKKTLNCESCHGPGSAHVKAGGGRGVGGIISFRPNDTSRTAEENNAICLSCHDKGDRTLWQGSSHETRGLACTNCHTVMKDVSRKHQLKTAFQPDTCFQCHKNKNAEMWRTAHMPVREGKITCTNCHNPHGSFSEALLKQATVNDTCYQCHAEKRGPFLWEHAPVRENCLNCHDPHGSTNEFMLKISRPRLCQQCHGTSTGHPGNPRNPSSVYAINRECQNCHSQHHGSNSPAGVRFQR